MAMGDGRPAALAARRPPAKASHLCRKASLVDEDEVRRIKVGLAVEPRLTSLREICTFLL
jgi:hypothetical protein